MARGLPLAAVGGCAKPGCTHRAPLNRHHKAHEALWLSSWAHRRAEPRYRQLVARYYEFREEDVVLVCLPHHAEIHSRYDQIIEEDRLRTGRPLYLYSWAQQRTLASKLRAECFSWLLEETPGLDSTLYERTKELRRKLLRKRLRRANPRAPNNSARSKAKLRKKKRRRRSK